MFDARTTWAELSEAQRVIIRRFDKRGHYRPMLLAEGIICQTMAGQLTREIGTGMASAWALTHRGRQLRAWLAQ